MATYRTIQTRDNGEITVNTDQIIPFPSGLIGFPELTEFAWLGDQLQSTKDSQVCFTIRAFDSQFKGETPIIQPADCTLVVIACIGIERKTVNLKAPIIMKNGPGGYGVQIILQDKRFTTRHEMKGE